MINSHFHFGITLKVELTSGRNTILRFLPSPSSSETGLSLKSLQILSEKLLILLIDSNKSLHCKGFHFIQPPVIVEIICV